MKVDTLSYKEQEASLLEKLGRFSEGEELYMKLLSENPDNYGYQNWVIIFFKSCEISILFLLTACEMRIDPFIFQETWFQKSFAFPHS